MNNLLFTAITLALLWYFFYYLPQQKKNTRSGFAPQPTFQHQATQTDPQTIAYDPGPKNTINCPGAITIPNPNTIKKLETEKQELLKDQAQKEKTITGLNNSYQKLETKSKTELDNLKQQLQAKEEKIKELSEVEKSLDEMIKGMQDLNKNL